MPIRLEQPSKASILSTPVPKSTNTYKAVSHGQIIDLISENLDKQGLRIINEQYAANMGNQIITGHFQLGIDTDPDLFFEIAFQNSYNKMKRAVVVAGSKVRICSNGHILGDSSLGLFRKKHSGSVDVDIVSFIPEMIKSSQDRFELLSLQKKQMREIEISKAVRNELIGQLYLDEGIISDTQMSIIKKQVANPAFDYGTDGNTVWDVYNHITYGLKNTHPSDWLDNHQVLNRVIESQFELA